MLPWRSLCYITITLFLLCLAEANFTINYEKNSFYLDGKPFRYVSGSAHYFRMPRQYWRDRLRKMRAGGLNAVSTYVEWSQHEPIPGQYDFSGNLNLTRYIEIAQEEGLYVILRPGPYICAERDMGGLPYWLISKNPDFLPRSSDPKFTKYVEKWMDVLLPKVYHQLHGNGGPIILVQVENEYGVYHVCDHKYNAWMRDLFRRHIGNKAVLFTTDSLNTKYLDCGKIPGVYATIDFGPEVDVDKAFSLQRMYEPRGPLVNSEYYVGWFTFWGDKMVRKPVPEMVKTLRKMLSMGANVNIYMYFGGTNFGFTAGAKLGREYRSYITSYDYDAPITEAGDLTEKYYAIRNVVSEYLTPPKNVSVKTADKGDYGELTLKVVASFLSPFVRHSLGRTRTSRYPLPFETLNQSSGYALYETFLRRDVSTPQEYVIKSYNDYAHVYLNGSFVGALQRERHENKFVLRRSSSGQVLGIVVENLGRINVGELVRERKGILTNVTTKGVILETWNMTSFELKTLKPIEQCLAPGPACNNGQGFYIYATKFVLPESASRGEENFLLDSFLNVKNLTKGVVFLNDFNLGRYWTSKGPQYTMYVPGVYLRPNPYSNTLMVIDENLRRESVQVKFSKVPIFSY